MLLAQGVELMVYGMGTVVVFLSVLVFATRLMSALAQRWLPEPEPSADPRVAAQVNGASSLSPQMLAAITAAMHRYRRERR